MESHSGQGLAILTFLVAFTFLACALFWGGNLVLMLLFLVGAASSVALFRQAEGQASVRR